MTKRQSVADDREDAAAVPSPAIPTPESDGPGVIGAEGVPADSEVSPSDDYVAPFEFEADEVDEPLVADEADVTADQAEVIAGARAERVTQVGEAQTRVEYGEVSSGPDVPSPDEVAPTEEEVL